MQWKREASEPCHKTEPGNQLTHSKRVVRLSATVPVVQIPTWVGTQQNARMQMCPGGAYGKCIHERASRTEHASELKQNPRNPLQFIERLPIAKFHQASSLVQIQRKREASEPRIKVKSGSQPAHNKRIARISATVPVVQIPGGAGMPRNANVPWRHFWQGYPPNAQQNSPCI